MHAFWHHGCEGTSMTTLMTTIDMSKTSIYATYGSKEALFQKALDGLCARGCRLPYRRKVPLK
ncbi:MAG TPA: TetR/AcrR family transcriptional regulator [Methylophilus sp.]|nr:TetR/AcrR family transcriptional regulator [Methylophilus sp.]